MTVPAKNDLSGAGMTMAPKGAIQNWAKNNPYSLTDAVIADPVGAVMAGFNNLGGLVSSAGSAIGDTVASGYNSIVGSSGYQPSGIYDSVSAENLAGPAQYVEGSGMLGMGDDISTAWGDMSSADQFGLAAGVAMAGLQGYNAYQANEIAEDKLDFQMDAFNKNYNMQKTAYNDNIQSRNRTLASATGSDQYAHNKV